MAKKKEDYYEGVSFFTVQSGSPNQSTERLEHIIKNLTIDLHKEKIRLYTVLQIGTPPPPTGGGHPS